MRYFLFFWPVETESCDDDFQWQCGLFYFQKDRQDVYA